MKTYAAFSGGKDSTAMVHKMAEQGDEFELLFTPTGNELPELQKHLETVAKRLNKEIIVPKGPSLEGIITTQKMMPSQLSRWCTRMIKIVPCIAHLKRNPGSSLAVGLRADEDTRIGLYGNYANYSYPLRDLGMREREVLQYVQDLGYQIPQRTDCAICPYQRIGEWFRLWKYNPEHYQQGIEWESLTGHTVRSPTQQRPRKDGSIRWAISLADLAKQFESGDKPKTLDDNDEEKSRACRVCRM